MRIERRGRRPSPAWFLLLLVVVLAIGLPRLLAGEDGADGDADARPPRPNVLVIITDDQRAAGSLSPAMPNVLRWFRDEGTAYPNGFVTTPLCCPSRASMMNGQYAHNHRVISNAWEDVRKLDQETTVQRYLRDAGYRTAIFGKYYNHWPLRRPPPHFDRWSIFFRGYENVRFNVQGSMRRVPYSTTFVGEQAVEFVRSAEREDGTPWLMFVTPFAPHGRATPEPRYHEAPVGEWSGNPSVLERDRGDKPSYILEEPRAPFQRHQKRAAAERRTLISVDDIVANLARVLEENGESRDTLAFFVSDNGKLWGEHGWYDKRLPYTASIRVPFFARWPAGGLAGTVDDRLVANVDIAATILHAARITPSHRVDGRSLLDGSWDRDRLLLEFWEGGDVPSWASIYTPSAQYVEYYAGDAPDGPVTEREYYDLRSDPWQLRNLLGDVDATNDPDVSSLAEAIARYRTCRGTHGPSACP